jgi:hypothetical protein
MFPTAGMPSGVTLLFVAVLGVNVLLCSCVKISPDLPPASRSWNSTGNSATLIELPFNYTARGPNGVVLTTVKTVPGCAPEQVRSAP